MPGFTGDQLLAAVDEEPESMPVYLDDDEPESIATVPPQTAAGVMHALNHTLANGDKRGPFPSIGISILSPSTHWILRGRTNPELRFEQGSQKHASRCEVHCSFIDLQTFLSLFHEAQALVQNGQQSEAAYMLWNALSVFSPSADRPFVVNGLLGTTVLLYQLVVRGEPRPGQARTARLCDTAPDHLLENTRCVVSTTLLGLVSFGLWNWAGAALAGVKFASAMPVLLAFSPQLTDDTASDDEDDDAADVELPELPGPVRMVHNCQTAELPVCRTASPVASGRGEDFL